MQTWMGASGQVPPRMSCAAGVSGRTSAVDGGIGESHVSRQMVLRHPRSSVRAARFVDFEQKNPVDSQLRLDVGGNLRLD